MAPRRTMQTPWTARRVAGGVARRIPLRPLRPLFPFRPWRALFRLWLATIRSQRDPRKAMRELLEIYGDAYERGVDLGAIAYDGGVHAKHRLMAYHDFFVERVRPGQRVLDVGCGKGEVAIDLAERAGASVTAIDRSPWALDFARARHAHDRVRYVLADALEYEPEQQFDVVILSNVLEHVAPREHLLRRLRERTGASLLLVRVPVLARDWIVPLRRELGLPHFSDPTHETEYDVDQLRAELAAAGWEIGAPTLVWGEIWAEARAVPAA